MFGAAMATDGESPDGASAMMGGDCAMLGMMGHGMMGQGRMRHGRMHRGRRMNAMAEGRLALSEGRAWKSQRIRNRLGIPTPKRSRTGRPPCRECIKP